MLDHGYSIERLGRELGIAPHRVRYRLQLMAPDPSLQDMLQGQNSAPVAHEIGRLPNPPRAASGGLAGDPGLSLERQTVNRRGTLTPDRRAILMRWTAPAPGIEVP
jgi:hypothetical protein